MICITTASPGGEERLGWQSFIEEQKSKISFDKIDYLIILSHDAICSKDETKLKYNLKALSSLPFPVLFVDSGNENFELLNSYPVEIWNGGKVHQVIKDKVIHLMRGQVFHIQGNTFFTMGGELYPDGPVLDIFEANKINKVEIEKNASCMLGEVWWRKNYPSPQELQEGLENVERENNVVDYILTLGLSTSKELETQDPYVLERINYVTDYFDLLEAGVKFTKWIHGHYITKQEWEDNGFCQISGFKMLVENEQ